MRTDEIEIRGRLIQELDLSKNSRIHFTIYLFEIYIYILELLKLKNLH